MKKFAVFAAVFALCACVWAEDLKPLAPGTYPASQITVTVCPAPGGGTDVMARLLATHMQEYLGVPVNVVNKTGGATAIGYTAAVNDPADGSALVVGLADLLALPYITDFAYSFRDYEPICNFNACYGTITVPADAPYNTITEFIDWMKKNPGKARFSNGGIGTPWHIVSAMFAKLAGVDIVHTPFDGGNPATIAVAGGNVECTTSSDSEVKTYVESGLVKILLTFAPERLAAFPDVPCAKEFGLEEASKLVVFRGFNAPKGTPKQILEYIDQATRYALAKKEVIDFMEANSFTNDYMPTQDYWNLMVEMDKVVDQITHEQGIATK